MYQADALSKPNTTGQHLAANKWGQSLLVFLVRLHGGTSLAGQYDQKGGNAALTSWGLKREYKHSNHGPNILVGNPLDGLGWHRRTRARGSQL